MRLTSPRPLGPAPLGEQPGTLISHKFRVEVSQIRLQIFPKMLKQLEDISSLEKLNMEYCVDRREWSGPRDMK